jgi:diguanylate cyclase (GGDEF)-like protein/PAS domain S-box-containing protein
MRESCERGASSQLFEAEARYRSLVEQVPAVVYEDRGHTTIYVSPQIEDILGVTPDSYMQDAGMWLRMVHPDDREWVQAQSEAFLAGEGGDLDAYRMVRPDGRVVWVRDRAYAYRDDAGRVILEQGLLFDVTELKEAEARVTHMAYHDALTGLPNRELFQESLLLAVERARRDQTSIGVLYLDLDNFKHLNDTLGHHAGDQLLVGLAERLRRSTRDVDLVARQSGDEFLILLADLDPIDAPGVIALVRSGSSKRSRIPSISTARPSARTARSASAGSPTIRTMPAPCCVTRTRRCTRRSDRVRAAIGITLPDRPV